MTHESGETCPEMPAWLEKLTGFEEERGHFRKLPEHIQDFYFLYDAAKFNHDAGSAAQIAVKYETGDVPTGPDIELAINWHRYAVENGSVSSALRLAEHFARSDRSEQIEAGIKMAKQALEMLLEHFYLNKHESYEAAAAAKYLLARKPDEESRALVEQLLSQKKFINHPDHEHIASALHRIKCQTGEERLSLKVAQSIIPEDGSFKAGLYKNLELPLPLAPVPLDPDAIKKTLNHEFPWIHRVNEQIYRQLVVSLNSAMPAVHFRPLLLVGLPGVGKTTWVRRLAELCKVPYRTVMAAGGADSMFLRGTPRGWSSARPGAVIQAIASEGVANPLFLVDELEKASGDSHNGRIWDVMLQLLEPASSRTYLDECLQVPCDLSWASWIASANTLSGLPQPLLERFTVMLVEPPGEGHFMALVDGAVRSYAGDLGVDSRMLPALEADALEILRRCRNPREVNRTVRMMIEERLVESRHDWRH